VGRITLGVFAVVVERAEWEEVTAAVGAAAVAGVTKQHCLSVFQVQ
jgi:hypothetical protein